MVNAAACEEEDWLLVAGCWLLEEGYSCDAALDRIQELRQKTPDHYTRSPETDEQVAFVRKWGRV